MPRFRVTATVEHHYSAWVTADTAADACTQVGDLIRQGILSPDNGERITPGQAGIAHIQAVRDPR